MNMTHYFEFNLSSDEIMKDHHSDDNMSGRLLQFRDPRLVLVIRNFVLFNDWPLHYISDYS